MKRLSLLSRISRISAAAVILATAIGIAFAGTNYVPPFGTWVRLSETPILSPREHGFEAAGVFNPAVVMHGDEFVMLYRAQDTSGTSRLGFATSKDGVHFT